MEITSFRMTQKDQNMAGKSQNMLEIERKFLVHDMESWRVAVTHSEEIRQGYFRALDAIIRVRIADDKSFLTIKSQPLPNSIARYEFEYEVPIVEAEKMLNEFCGQRLVEKTRYYTLYGSSEWVVDTFQGKLGGLILAEIELKEESDSFDVPDWIGEELTENPRFTNGALARLESQAEIDALFREHNISDIPF